MGFNMFDELEGRKYSIIYCDPPWEYATTMHNGKESTGGAESHYPTMKEKELCAMPVNSIAEEDSLLFMWIGSPKMPEALRVGEAWGFKYSTIAFVWDKAAVVPGSYTMSQCELCLVFKKGKIPKPRGDRNIEQLLRCKRGRHSEKPLQIKDRIHKMFPDQDKIELFCRPIMGLFPIDENWDHWGNQVDEDVYHDILSDFLGEN